MIRQVAVLFLCVMSAVSMVNSLPNLQQSEPLEKFLTVTSTFNCTGRSPGFYADLTFECTLFHKCDKDDLRLSYQCGSGTAFNQQYRMCDWIQNFDCNEAEKWYYLNDVVDS